MQYIKISLSTALTVFAFMFDRIYDVEKPLLVQFASQADYVGIAWCALAVFIFAFYRKSWQRHKGFQKIEAVFAVLFSVLMLIGRSFSVCDSLKMLASQKMMTLFAGLGWLIFFYMLLRWVSCFVEVRHSFVEKTDDCQNIQLIAFVLIALCWLPQWLLTLPGSVPYDSMYQLCQWFGYSRPTDHHPWFITMVFGFLMSIGRNISDNAGVLVVILFQFTFCAWAYSRVCLSVARYVGRKSAYFTALFFAVVPFWGAYAVTIHKDTWFSAIFAVYFCSFLDIFEGKKLDTKKWLIFGLLSLLVCLTRHEGIYVVLFAGTALLFVLCSERKQLLGVLLGICICMIGYDILIFNVLGVSKGSVKEMLSIPFQQTARYSRDHGKKISKNEKNIINKVLPYDELAKLYNSELSDPVKSKMKKLGKKDLKKYFRVWLRMGLRHPGTYLQATISNSYNYYYPFRKCKVRGPQTMYIAGKPVNKGFDIYYMVEKRKALVDYNELWCTLPGISLLSNTGAHTWVVLIGIMLLLKKRKYRELVIIAPLLMRIATCCASPVNGHLRYAMSYMACTPVLLAWLAHTLCSKRGDDNG